MTIPLAVVQAAEQVLVQMDAPMVYIVNEDAQHVSGLDWTDEEFVDTDWTPGTYGVGYNAGGMIRSELTQEVVDRGVASIYTRAYFTIDDVSAVSEVRLGVDYDDGYVAWINGFEVLRSGNMTGYTDPDWDTPVGDPGFSDHESSNGNTPDYGTLHDITSAALNAPLHDGGNVLAIAVWNNTLGSSDMALVPRLSITDTTPPPPVRPAGGIRIIAPSRYLPNVRWPVRVELLTSAGAVDKANWDATVELTTDRPGEVTLSPASVNVLHGMGSASVSIGGAGPVTIIATYGDRQAEITVTEAGPEVREVSGTLPSGLTEWGPQDGVVRVTGDVDVPSGGTLRLLPGTIVLMGDGRGITVRGAFEAEGTAAEPVLITAADWADEWRQIDFADGHGGSALAYTFLSRGGDAPSVGHCCGPVLRGRSGGAITFDHCNVIDCDGKGMDSSGAELHFAACLFHRVDMGFEISSPLLRIDGCYFLEITPGGDAADDDGIYLKGWAGSDMRVRDSVFAVGGDDGIDTLGTNPVIENCIIRGWEDKGVSIFYESPVIRGCLIADNAVGITGKGDDTDFIVENTTIVRCPLGLWLRKKDNTNWTDIVGAQVTNTVIWDVEQLVQNDYWDYSEDRSYLLRLYYCTVQDPQDNLQIGTPVVDHVFYDDPQFINPAGGDYRLSADSPCIDSGDPGTVVQPDDVDLFATPRLVGDAVDIGAFEFRLPGDSDADGDVDLADFEQFQQCFTGPAVDSEPPELADACRLFDAEADGDVDLRDFHLFILAFTGPRP